MKIKRAYLKEICFQFNFQAKTSRNTLSQKSSHFIVLESEEGQLGIGECSPIYGLSIESEKDLRKKLAALVAAINEAPLALPEMDLKGYPSIRFALNTALQDLTNGGQRQIFKNDFSNGKKSIPINGLIWMSDISTMLKQVKDKIDREFACIKIKIGSQQFEDELSFLSKLRRVFNADIEIRLDANGAFSNDTALEKLKRLSEYDIHSIEQPIAPKQIENMALLCKESPIPIALDEELIGLDPHHALSLLKSIGPQFIILKPTLIGDFQDCEKWIQMAQTLNIGWWATSALESNVGLNAIAQWVSQFNHNRPQGLGTGQIYSNNIPSPLVLNGDQMKYEANLSWDIDAIVK